jgi:hypothetical protein
VYQVELKPFGTSCRHPSYDTVHILIVHMRAIFKVCGHSLLLQVRILGRCSDSLFFKVPPLASDALLTMLHPLLKNMLQTIDHLNFLPWSSLFMVGKAQKLQARSGLYVRYSNGVLPIHFFQAEHRNQFSA